MPANTEIIYLDNNSSTRIDPAVLEEMMPFLTTQYGNPSGSHRFGTKVKEATDLAHERVAALLGCEPNEIVFTSGGTESDNTAIHSALQMSPERRHLVTTSVEHNAVLNYCEAVVRNGCAVSIHQQYGLDRSLKAVAPAAGHGGHRIRDFLHPLARSWLLGHARPMAPRFRAVAYQPH
jgi:selenocysteine lyase/cysteine desulfurase